MTKKEFLNLLNQLVETKEKLTYLFAINVDIEIKEEI